MVLLSVTGIPKDNTDIQGEDDEEDDHEETGKGKNKKAKKNKQIQDGRRGNLQMLRTQ